MRFTIFLVSLFLFSTSFACLNLTGKLSGSCVYSSESFGDLNGSLEFNIQQNSCSQITIDGSTLSIPGSVSEQHVDGVSVQNMTLAMSWQSSKQDILNYDYTMTVDENGKRVDDVKLNGSFKQEGNKVILRQKGVVDKDPVQIYCELYKRKSAT